jgi:hypothetical protein
MNHKFSAEQGINSAIFDKVIFLANLSAMIIRQKNAAFTAIK